MQTNFGDPTHPQVVIVPDPSGNPKSFPMYATMRHTPHTHPTGPTPGGGELFPEFVPPPPPMFEAGAKPPLPPGKPDKIVCKNPPGGKKGEKKRESTV